MNAQSGVWRRQFLFGWLNLALTAPAVYLWLGLPLIMRQHGWSGTDIGLFQLAGLPAVFKFALAWPIERAGVGGRRYRHWAIGLSVLFVATLLLIGRQELLSSRTELFTLAFIAALLTTWADVPVNALAIRLLPESQRIRAGGVRSAALSLGAIVGGGLMLLVQAQWGWRAPFFVLSALVLIGVAMLWRLDDTLSASDIAVASGASAKKRYGGIAGFFGQPAAWRWTLLLMLCFPFIGAAWFYLKPLMLDHGFAPQQVAALVGVGGGVVAALASMAAARLIRRIGIARALPACTGFSTLALAVMAGAVGTGAPGVMLIAAALLVAVAMGAAATLAFGLTMYFARQALQAADYGLQASLFSLSRMVVPLVCGVLLDRQGYAGMLAVLAVVMVLVSVFALMSGRTIALAAQAPVAAS